MNRGYIKLWRKSIDSGWIKNHKLWAFWSYCLLKASHQEFDAIIGVQTVHLLPGQFIFGLRIASSDTGLSIREIRTILAFLKKAENLTIKSTNKFSIITIVNWPIYQGDVSGNDKQNDKPLTNKGQHTRIKEHKKEYSIDFETFWKSYPKKAGSKKEAFNQWNKLNGTRPHIETIIVAIQKQMEWRKNASAGEFRPEWKDAERWIKHRMWEAELTTVKTMSQKSATDCTCPRCGRQVPPQDKTPAGCIYCDGTVTEARA